MLMNDRELLREYAAARSQAAFGELVRRHINLVYSAARRQVRDPHLAEDITQQVFTLLARKAGGLGGNTVLSAWLYRATRHVASQTLRAERRRQRREQVAAEVMNLSTPDTLWQQIEPLLDEAMAALAQADHDAIVLRYFEDKSLKEVGAVMGTSEDAAQKRVARALEKLRGGLQRCGLVITATALAAAVTTGAVQAAPPGLAASVSSASLLGASAATTGGLVANLIKLMAATKIKLAIATAVVVAVGIPFVLRHRAGEETPAGETGPVANASTPTNRPSTLVRRVSASRAGPAVPATLFERIYSPDPKQFVANLREIHCPESTVKDILVAEAHRRFGDRERALEPRPADHVSYTWSAWTSEPKLVARRQEAASLAREESAWLRDALGYEVAVPKPLYALTAREQLIEQGLATQPPERREAIRQAQEDYWTRVQGVQEGTKGFWQTADAAEIDRIKDEFWQEVTNIVGKVP